MDAMVWLGDLKSNLCRPHVCIMLSARNESATPTKTFIFSFGKNEEEYFSVRLVFIVLFVLVLI